MPRREQIKLIAFVIGKAMKMDTIRKYLQGKKTYVAGFGAIVATIVAWVNGGMETPQVVEAIVAAMMGMFIRAGVSSEAAKQRSEDTTQ